MNERMEELLRGFQPRPVSVDLHDRIAADLAQDPPAPAPMPWADRCLAATLAIASLAACVIVALTLSAWAQAPTAPAPSPQANVPTLPLEHPWAMARGDAWMKNYGF